MLPAADHRRYLIPFRSILLPQIFTDTLVLGAGAAGLVAALRAAQHGDVILVTKDDERRSSTAWAQGGIAAVLGGDDTVGEHVADTLAAGAGLCDLPAVQHVCEHGSAMIERLLEVGFPADRDAEAIALGREGGHGRRRIVHSNGDATGAALSRCLSERVRATGGVRLFESCFALDLLTPTDAPGAPCVGAITHHPKYGLQVIWARATILASGGAGKLWRETSNPPVATGDGLAMAYRAGASVADLAFMQFHPTALYVAGAERLLISEAVRGEGAHLVDASGNRFMLPLHELAELAPRDVVASGIQRTLAASGASHVYLDARHVPGFATRFPSIARRLADFGVDPAVDLIPVNPAAHYLVGGVRTDLDGRTDVPGLYAVGEVASTGLHGANRLASNSLLEALVMGESCGAAAEEMRSDDAAHNGWGVAPRSGPMQVISNIPPSERGELDLGDVRSSLRSAMWRNVGVERSGGKLADMLEMCDFWARYTLDKIFDDPHGWETQNMLLCAALTTRSAAWRQESRGCHRRSDHPVPDEAFAVHDLWRRGIDAPRTLAVAAGEVPA